jgi:hypothetical protein
LHKKYVALEIYQSYRVSNGDDVKGIHSVLRLYSSMDVFADTQLYTLKPLKWKTLLYVFSHNKK